MRGYGVRIVGCHVACDRNSTGGRSNFTEFLKGPFNHSLYPRARGRGSPMSHISFNRKKAKLKRLLGIRARLALLAVILVVPLMLERARSLEDARGKQVALAT